MPRLRPLAGLLLAALALPAAAQEDRSLAGTAGYPMRIALPPEAVLTVEVRGPGGESLALADFPTRGAQVPLPFALELPANASGTLRAAVRFEGRTRWLTAPVALEPGHDDLGELRLLPHVPFGLSEDILCGGTRLRIGFAGDRALALLDGRLTALALAGAASGARYAAQDGGLVVWTKGGEAQVERGGTALEGCRFVPPSAPPAWTARGHEPGWSLSVEGGHITLARQSGATVETGVSDPAIDGEAFVYRSAEPALTLSLTEAICHDSMTGMPHPETVAVGLEGEALTGCGGDPAALLEGPEWRVEDIGGRGLIDGSGVTMQFAAGRIGGRGGCNRYTGPVTLTGEGLSIGPPAGTMMACAEALMAQEHAFHAALGAVTGFDIDETGALLLKAGEETVVTARR